MAMEVINSINRKINDTKTEISRLIESEDSSSVLTQFMLSELNRRLESLIEQKNRILDAQAKETVALRLYGEAVEYGKISNRILVSILGGFQTLIDSIAAFADGAVGTRGKISDNAKILTDFKVTGVFAGSFGVVLEKDCQQMELTENSTKTGNVLGSLFDILENSSDANKLIGHISPYGKRTVNHYKDWLKSIKADGINIEMNWTDDSAAVRKLDISHSKVEDVIYTLDCIEDISNEDIELQGTLTGINIRQNTFEMKYDGGIIKGTSKLETLIQISSMIGSEIKASLVKSTWQNTDFVSKVSWYLEKIIKD